MGLSASSLLICRRPTQLRILIFGLDAAGKTSVLYRLKLGELLQTIPTFGFNVESIPIDDGRATMTMWDIGGRDKIRPLFRHYYSGSHGVAFVIDSNDRERLPDALEELNRIAEALTTDGLPDLPIAVLCNKCDLQTDAASEALANVQKAQQQLSGIQRHPCSCFAVSAATGEGLKDAMDWLVRAALHEETEKVAEPEEAEAKAPAKAADVGWSGLYHMVKSVMMR